MNLDDIKNDKEWLVQEILEVIDPDYKNRSQTHLEKEKRDIRYTLLFTMEGIENINATLIINYYRWLIDTLSAYNIKKDILFKMHRVISEKLLPYLSEAQKTFLEHLDIEQSLTIKDPFKIDEKHTVHKLYLDALLNKNREQALQVVNQHLEDGMDLKTLYMDVIQISLYEIGYLWQTKKITVADEHLATVITQFVIATLYPKIFATQKHDKKVLGAGVGKELHEIGIRMVMDFFEIDGYQTQYLGCNIPPKEIVAYALDFQPDIIALSITLPIHIGDMKKTVAMIRDETRLDHVKIIIGGQPFLHDTALYNIIGADGFAKNAVDALKVGGQLVAKTA